LPTTHRPNEVQVWVKRHINKKDIAPTVDADKYGKLFIKWWAAMQPSWRNVVADGGFSRTVPDDEKWDSLAKGGTTGIYVVVMALSWWIKAIGNATGKEDAWMVVQDLSWVLTQIRATFVSKLEPRGTKRTHDGSLNTDHNIKNKRYLYICVY
jgi:hypothetical protein